MTCKRQGEARSDLHTLADASRLDNIRWVAAAVGQARCCAAVDGCFAWAIH